ncbi:MAG: response regulator transcription factor [Actinomycetota bacterium]|nr:response regulator transcription factor [Actinomycetota bacterium]
MIKEETLASEDIRSTGRLQRTLSPSDEHRKLRVLLVDDEDVVHWGFRMLLGDESWVESFAAAHNPGQAVELASRHEPHVAVVDVLLQRESGVNVCKAIREASPSTRVLLMSGRDTISSQSARAVGAAGFVPKTWGAHDLVGATRMVGLGMTVFASEAPQPPNPLSQREREVLEMLAGGATNREIAARLFLSPHTVKDHTSALYKKINARNRADAILRAQRMGLIA